MKQLKGKSCRLSVMQPVTKKILFYTVKTVINVTETHISFIDKFNKEYSYRLVDVLQVQDIKRSKGGEIDKKRH